MIKICEICGKEFENIQYGNKRKYCFDCSPKYNDDTAPKGKHVTMLRIKMKETLVQYKGGKCEKCGYNKCIDALEFHHLDANAKEFSISSYCATNHSDFDKAKAEIDKCQLLCANCHREEHAKIKNESPWNDNSVGRVAD